MADVGRQAERSRRTRERLVQSTVDLIRGEGLRSATPVRIAQHTGVSWGAVQHHFGSKEQLLKTIVMLSRDMFIAKVREGSYAGLDLDERIALFLRQACQHYQSDVFLASVEITFWYRNSGQVLDDDISSDEGRTSALITAAVEDIFAGTASQTQKLLQATEYMHCVLTGLAFQNILSGPNRNFDHHLAHCRRAMKEIIFSRAT